MVYGHLAPDKGTMEFFDILHKDTLPEEENPRCERKIP